MSYDCKIKKISMIFIVVIWRIVFSLPSRLVIIVIPLYCIIVLKRVTSMSLKDINNIIQSFTVVDNIGKSMKP